MGTYFNESTNPRLRPFDARPSYPSPAGEQREEDVPLIFHQFENMHLKNYIFRKLNVWKKHSQHSNSAPAVLNLLRTTRAHDSHMALTTRVIYYIHLMQENVILLCGDTSWQYHSRCFWIARLLLSRSQRQIAFVPSVTLMYEKFKMSLV